MDGICADKLSLSKICLAGDEFLRVYLFSFEGHLRPKLFLLEANINSCACMCLNIPFEP